MQTKPLLITSALRGTISRAIREAGSWNGRRAGVRMQFALSAQPDLEGNRIEWRARIGKQWQQGKSGTVFDAVRDIEKAAARQTLKAAQERTT